MLFQYVLSKKIKKGKKKSKKFDAKFSKKNGGSKFEPNHSISLSNKLYKHLTDLVLESVKYEM